jgi:hypothetical protein
VLKNLPKQTSAAVHINPKLSEPMILWRGDIIPPLRIHKFAHLIGAADCQAQIDP